MFRKIKANGVVYEIDEGQLMMGVERKKTNLKRNVDKEIWNKERSGKR